METFWYSAFMLAVESQAVIGLRLMKLAAGGAEAQDEAVLMVGEKIATMMSAGTALAGGASAISVIDGVRAVVGANSTRLSATPAA